MTRKFCLLLVLLVTCSSFAEEAKQTREHLVGRIEADPDNIAKVLRVYNSLENRGQFDIHERRRIHEAIVAALRKVDHPSWAETARSILRRSGDSNLPMHVVVMKTLLGRKFPASRPERVELLAEIARGRSERLTVWAVRLMGDSKWRESIDALIGILREEEADSNAQSFLAGLVSAELYRALGKYAEQGSTSTYIDKQWKKAGGRVPEKPDYRPDESGRTVFFGDMISPKSVFVIDISSSMRQVTSLKIEGSRAERTRTKESEKKRGEGVRRPKVDIVKAELEKAVSRLQPYYEFNIVSYDRSVSPWRARGTIKLQRASERNMEAAAEFARRLEVGSGTNIYDSVAAALGVRDVETIYLLSDGQPSVGGGPEDIERNVAALNYLGGVRIITYGFAPEGEGGAYDEDFMRRLATRNRGWYRRLNQR